MALRFGTTGNDNFNASSSSDIFIGFSGSDTIRTGSGNDFVFAGNGIDTITVSGTGNKVLRGGGSNDTFEFSSNTSGVAVIRDFEDGADKIDLSDFGVTDISELNIQSSNSGSTITIDGLTISVTVSPGSLSNADFILAEIQGTTLDFEDIVVTGNSNGASEPISNGYHGLNWTNFYVLDEALRTEQVGINGYQPTSGGQVAFNGFGDPASISSSSDFDLEQAQMAAAWRDDLEVTISAWDDGVYQGSQTVVLDYGQIETVHFDNSVFTSVDHVEFVAAGGTDHSTTDHNNDTHFSMDDLIIA